MIQRINKVSGQGGFTIIELVAVLVVLGIIVSYAVARMNNNTAVFKEKAVVGLVNAFNSHESGEHAEYLMNGGGASVAAMSAATYDATGLSLIVTGNPDYAWTAPADSTAAAAGGVNIDFQGGGVGSIVRNCTDGYMQCRWAVE